MLNINNLFYFFKTVECGSYSAAAKVLYLSPQAISNGVSSLEKELGLRLIENKQAKATPTPSGIAIFEQSLAVFEAISNLESTAKLTKEIDPSAMKGNLRIAVSSFLAEGILSTDFWNPFRKLYPNIDLSFSPAGTDKCILEIEEGTADVGIVLGSFDGVRKHENLVFTISLQPIVAQGHPLAKQKNVSFNDVCRYPILEPSNAAYCNLLVRQQLKKYAQAVSFFSIGSWDGAINRFLTERQGVVLAAEDTRSSIEADIPISPIDTNQDEKLSLTVFYLKSKQAPKDLSLCLKQYLSSSRKSKDSAKKSQQMA